MKSKGVAKIFRRKPPTLRPPSPTFNRVVRVGVLSVLWFLLEKQDPLPFTRTPAAWVLFILILGDVVRQFMYRRLETKPSFVVRTRMWRARWEEKRDLIDPMTRYRLRKLVIGVVGYFIIVGGVVALFSDRCEGIIQCGTLAPMLAIEQMPSFIMMMLGFTLSLAQLGGVFLVMAKVGSYTISLPGTIQETFDDVFGQDKAKARVMEQVALLDDSTAIEEAGGHMIKGLLLHGPPGTGKTLLAKASANMTRMPMINVPVGGFASTFFGINFLKIRLFFRAIEKTSLRHGGCLVFFDEFDSLGNRGGAIEGAEPADVRGCTTYWEPDTPVLHSARPMRPIGRFDRLVIAVTNTVFPGGNGMNMGTLEAFLAGLDGMDRPRGLTNKLLGVAGFQPLPKPKTKFLLIAATNRKDAIDPALLRAGRVEEHIYVGYPDFDGKRATYDGYLSRITHELSDEDIDRMARLHSRASGAEIEAIVNKAILMTFRGAAENPGVVTYDHMLEAMLVKRHGEPTGVFEKEENRRAVAIHEAGHAVAEHHLMREHEEIWFASIEKRGSTGGMVSPSPLSDDWMVKRDDTINDIAVSLASRVAEKFVLGWTSNGHNGDGRSATAQAEHMLMTGGHPNLIGQYVVEEDISILVEELLAEAMVTAIATVEPRLDQVEAVAALLVDRLTVPGHEIHDLLDEMEAAR